MSQRFVRASVIVLVVGAVLGIVGCSPVRTPEHRAQRAQEYTQALLEEDYADLEKLGDVDSEVLAQIRSAIPDRLLYDSAPPQAEGESQNDEGMYDVPVLIHGMDVSLAVHVQFAERGGKVVGVYVE